MLDHLTVGDFIGHMNATFRVNIGSGEVIDLELIEAKTIGEGARPGLPGIREQALSLIFRGQRDPMLPHRIHPGTSSPPGAMSAALTSTVGGGQPHENRQPYLVLNDIIALQGDYPSRT
jgi:hypothetical protein